MPIFLHAGCGQKNKYDTTPEFKKSKWKEIRLDINPVTEPDIISSITDMSEVNDQAVNALYTSHTIEHLYQHEVSLAFSEFHRVLSEDGYVIITCPDLYQIARLILDGAVQDEVYTSASGPVNTLDMIFGYGPSIEKGSHYMAHHTGFTLSSLFSSLSASGFSSHFGFSRTNYFELWVASSKIEKNEEDMRTLAMTHFPK